MKLYCCFLFFLSFALPSLASTPGLFDEVLSFLKSFKIPEVKPLEPGGLKDHRRTVQNAITYFEAQSREYEEEFNKLSEEEKKIIKAKVDLFPAFGRIDLHSTNSFVKSELFRIAKRALNAMHNTLIRNIGGKSDKWNHEFKLASFKMYRLGNSITVLLEPQFEILRDLLKDTGDKGQRVINHVQLSIDIFVGGESVLGELKSRQDILDQVSTIYNEYSKMFYFKSQREDDYAKRLEPVKEMLKDEKEFQRGEFKEFSELFMRFLLCKHFASLSEEDIVKLLFVQGEPVIQRFWEEAKLIFETEEDLKHGYLVKFFNNECESSLLFKFFPMNDLMAKYPDLKSVGEKCMKNTFFPQATQEQVISEIEGEKERRLAREAQEEEKKKREEEGRLLRELQEKEKRLAKKTSEEERRLLREEQEKEKMMREEEKRLDRVRKRKKR